MVTSLGMHNVSSSGLIVNFALYGDRVLGFCDFAESNYCAYPVVIVPDGRITQSTFRGEHNVLVRYLRPSSAFLLGGIRPPS